MSLVILDKKSAQLAAPAVVEALMQRLKSDFEFHLRGTDRYDEIAAIAGELQNIARQLSASQAAKLAQNTEVKF
jgi:hypothetical protein